MRRNSPANAVLRCTDRQVFAGGVVLALTKPIADARFPLGPVRITPGAIAVLANAGQHATAFHQRHARGDRGTCGQCDQIDLTDDERRRGWEATDEEGKINKSNMLNGRDKIISMYETAKGTPLWVVTVLDNGSDTTVLVPEEY